MLQIYRRWLDVDVTGHTVRSVAADLLLEGASKMLRHFAHFHPDRLVAISTLRNPRSRPLVPLSVNGAAVSPGRVHFRSAFL